MCAYPNEAFPTHTITYVKHNQQIFADYGCWEAVDVDATESEQQIIVRKHRPQHATCNSLSANKTIDPRVLTPTHDFLTLGKPANITNLLEEDFDLTELLKERVVYNGERKVSHGAARKNTYIMTAPVEKYINTLTTDYPYITGGCFDEIVQPNIRKASKRKRKRFWKQKYLRHIDPSLCDVGRKLLRNIMQNESQIGMMKKYCDRDYSGGCLSYNNIGMRNNKQYGILVAAQGQCLEELCIKSLTIDPESKSIDGIDPLASHQQHTFFSKLEFQSEIRQSLNGRILQVVVLNPESSEDLIIGARSDYHVILNKFNKNHTVWNEGVNSASFSNSATVSSIGLLKSSGSSHLSSISLSPYIPGECAVATEDRCVRLWTPEVDKCRDSSSGANSLSNLEVLLNGTMGGLRSSNTWRQVCFAAHPRQIYITDDENVCLFDIRTQSSFRSIFNILSSKHSKEHEKIYCIESCRTIENEYQCLIATNFNLYLFDQRHCGQPLLQWGTNMKFPPQYIKTTKVCGTNVQDDVYPDITWSQSTSAILIGNQNAHEVYCYQMCNSKKLSTTQSKIYPPQAVGPPRILGSFKDVKNYLSKDLYKNGKYLRNRSSKMTVGLETIQLRAQAGYIVLQMNAVGDIGYQTLAMQNHEEVYDLSNIVTGKTPATFISIDEQHRRTLLQDMKNQNYENWAREVTSPDCNNDIDGRKTNLLKKQMGSPDEVRIDKRFFTKILFRSADVIKTNHSPICSLCAIRLSTIDTSSTDQASTSSTCHTCRTSITGSNAMLNLLKNPKDNVLCRSLIGKFEAEMNLSSSDTDKDDAESLRKLNLLNIEHTGDEFDNEVGRLLKATWKGTYQDYWNSLKQMEIERQQEQQNEQDRQTFDLSRRDELMETPQTPASSSTVVQNTSFLSILSRRTITPRVTNSPGSRKRKRDSVDGVKRSDLSSPRSTEQNLEQNSTLSICGSSYDVPDSFASVVLPIPDDSILSGSALLRTGSSGNVFAPTANLVTPPRKNSGMSSPPFSFFSPHTAPRSDRSFSSIKRRNQEYGLFLSRGEIRDNSPAKTTKKKTSLSQSIGF